VIPQLKAHDEAHLIPGRIILCYAFLEGVGESRAKKCQVVCDDSMDFLLFVSIPLLDLNLDTDTLLRIRQQRQSQLLSSTRRHGS
jgi:hypothetical protein